MPLNSLFLLGWQEKLGYRFTFPYDYGLFVLVLFFPFLCILLEGAGGWKAAGYWPPQE